jgi:hypothetical protein
MPDQRRYPRSNLDHRHSCPSALGIALAAAGRNPEEDRIAWVDLDHSIALVAACWGRRSTAAAGSSAEDKVEQTLSKGVRYEVCGLR